MEKITLYFPEQILSFAHSNARIVVAEGPRREGKTVGGYYALLYHKKRQLPNRDFKIRPYRGLILRDTHENLKTQICRTIAWCNAKWNLPYTFKDDYHKLGGPNWNQPEMVIDLFGIDSLADLSKLQGMAYDIIWIEEPAPVIEKTGVEGISVECFLMCLTSQGTEPDSVGRVQVTMNPSDEEHWTYPYFHEDVLKDRYGEDFKFFWIPPGSNPHFLKKDREELEKSLQDRPDLLRRYVHGKPAFIIPGAGVVAKDYNEEIHRTKRDHNLNPTPKRECVRHWDGGHWPTCVITQFQANGQLWVLDTIRSPMGQEGMEQHIKKNVNPILAHRYKDITSWRDMGDPSLDTREQTDIEQSPHRKIQELLITGSTVFEKGPRDPGKEGAEALRSILGRFVDGQPAILLSHHERLLHLALRGGWHTRTDSGGKPFGKPIKNIHSHPADALAHGLGLTLPMVLYQQKEKRMPSWEQKHPGLGWMLGA